MAPDRTFSARRFTVVFEYPVPGFRHTEEVGFGAFGSEAFDADLAGVVFEVGEIAVGVAGAGGGDVGMAGFPGVEGVADKGADACWIAEVGAEELAELSRVNQESKVYSAPSWNNEREEAVGHGGFGGLFAVVLEVFRG
jgi:hypothetical protein